MNKTLTINISGIVFHIDEDAFDILRKYLNRLNSHFNEQEGGSEIINDIESRIAELFSERLANSRGIINLSLVDEVVAIMGMPEDFADTDENSDEQEEQKASDSKPGYAQSSGRKLYRDTESRVFGGVCSGLAHYLHIDKVLMRIIFFVLIIATSGTFFLVYLVFWVAVPKARSTAQRLEMKGEPINVQNIGKSVKEEFGEMKDNFSKYKDSKEYKRAREYGHKAGSAAKDVGRGSANILGKLFGAILLAFGFLLLIALIAGAFATTRLIGVIPGLQDGLFFNHIFSGSLATTMVLAILIIIGIPVLLLIYAGTKLLFNYVTNSRSVVLSALGVWIIGLVILFSSGFGAFDVFSADASVSDAKVLTTVNDTIYLKLNKQKYDKYGDARFEVNNFKVVMVNDEELLIARPEFTIHPNDNNEVELRIRKYSKGNNYRNAKANIEKLTFDYSMEGSTLYLNPYFEITENGKWRNQEVTATLKIPEGKVVFIDQSLLPIIHNIENTTNTWDGDMVGLYWQMMPDGLTQLNK